MALSIQHDVPLAPRTTLGVGGVARFFVSVENLEDLKVASHFAKEKNLPFFILGGGSNVLFPDEGYDGLVIEVALRGISREEKGESMHVGVAAGEVWDSLVALAVEEGWWGIENLSGIPGLVGAAPVQNINAYGTSVAESVVAVEAYNLATDTSRIFSSEECQFSYRDSFFKSKEGSTYLITKVSLCLTHKGHMNTGYRSASQSMARYFEERGITHPSISDVRSAVLIIRKRIGMLAGMYQSVGSFFKNAIVSKKDFEKVLQQVEERHAEVGARLSPWHWVLPDEKVKISSAFLMECTPYNKTAFAKERFRDTVGISPLHTLSLINCGGATAKDIHDFATRIQETVHREFGVLLEPEAVIVKQ